MLLVLDVGNTNTVLGVFAHARQTVAEGDAAETPQYGRLLANWRVATSRTSTVDEYGVLFRNLFSMAGLEAQGIQGQIAELRPGDAFEGQAQGGGSALRRAEV